MDTHSSASDPTLSSLFAPQSVAIIGASANPGKVGNRILQNLIASGFGGTIVPVNPSAGSIAGLQCYTSLAVYGKKVEHAVIVVPRQFVLDAVKDSIGAGVGAITIITAGFKEQDAEGAALERQIVAVCHEAGVRLLGPNCLGLLNTHHNMDVSFANYWPRRGNISFISQSGALCSAILDRSAERKFGLGKLVSVGNKSELCEKDFLTALSLDDETKVIVLYLEGINDGPGFIETATKVSRKKPIIIFKSGVTSAGSKAASSHTGSLAGADVSYQAAFNRCGIIRPQTYEQIFEYAQAFSLQPLPKGKRVSVVTNAGGPGIMTADAIEMSGLQMAELSEPAATMLKNAFPAAASVKNPIDVLGDADANRYALALKTAQDDVNVDAIIVLLTPQAVTDCVATANMLCDAMNGTKPVLACFMGGADVGPARQVLLERGMPDFTSPEKAVHALKAMVEYATWLQKPVEQSVATVGDSAKVAEIIKSYRASGIDQVNEYDAKRVFRAYGIPTAAGDLAKSESEARSAAEKIGFPVVMKIVSPDIIHKSDIGGVKLNLKSSDEVAQAYTTMMERVLAVQPDARITGVYIEKMGSRDGLEVIAGMTRDPQFGPLIMFGLGGIFVEVLKDVTFRLAPLSKTEALEMMNGIKAAALLKGVRGKPGVDMDTLADTIVKLSRLVSDFPAIMELDINPFIATPDAATSFAADARITLAPQS